jgi:hypothetical protein
METSWRKCFSRQSIHGWIAAAGVTLMVSAPVPSAAVPITYEEDVLGANASGTFNGVPFAGALVILTFQADTSTVFPWAVTTPDGTTTTGFANFVGTGTVTVVLTDGTVVAQGTFLPSAGIFVSVDANHGGIGFGSFGVPRSNPNFPGQPAYPEAMFTSALPLTYDLTSNFTIAGSAISCVNFPATACGAGLPLAITSGGVTGELALDPVGLATAQFSATVQSVTPFASLKAEAEVATGGFELEGTFSLGAASDGIAPLSEAVTLQLDSYSVTITPGSFTPSRRGGYTFKGTIADVSLDFFLKAESPSTYRFEIEGAGKGLPQLPTQLSVQLTIGDDSGATTVTAEANREHGVGQAASSGPAGL